MPSKSEALADELRTLADDMKQLLVTLTTDPKEQRKKELRWRLLYGGLSAVFAVGARKLATRGWAILTGEEPPTKRAPQQPAAPAAEQETAVGI
jgi:hypothetical protein